MTHYHIKLRPDNPYLGPVFGTKEAAEDALYVTVNAPFGLGARLAGIVLCADPLCVFNDAVTEALNRLDAEAMSQMEPDEYESYLDSRMNQPL